MYNPSGNKCTCKATCKCTFGMFKPGFLSLLPVWRDVGWWPNTDAQHHGSAVSWRGALQGPDWSYSQDTFLQSPFWWKHCTCDRYRKLHSKKIGFRIQDWQLFSFGWKFIDLLLILSPTRTWSITNWLVWQPNWWKSNHQPEWLSRLSFLSRWVRLSHNLNPWLTSPVY